MKIPYPSNNSLPDSVRNVLPSKAQTLFREVWNSTYDSLIKKGVSKENAEKRAARAAWKIVGEHFKKTPSGKWVRK